MASNKNTYSSKTSTAAMLIDTNDRPTKWYQWIIYPLQMLLAVFVATVLIANICGTPISACLIGAAIGTIIYQILTNFKSPMFISSCGATCSAVIGALALGGGGNYLAVSIGGLIILLVYAIFAVVIKFCGIKAFKFLFPPIIIGPITMVIGLTLAGFLPTYIGEGIWPMAVALVTMFTTAVISHYFKGFMRSIAFLIGLAVGYGFACILTSTGVAPLVSFGAVDSFFSLPDFTFLKWDFEGFEIGYLLDIALLFIPVSICAVLENYADHSALSGIIGHDLTIDPGEHRALLGDGLASFVGTVLCGLPNTSYGESVAVIGFSRVASVIVTTMAAALLGLMAFITPVQVFLASIPSCVFGGSAMILYGYIAVSGLKTLINARPDLNEPKPLIIVSVILTVGVSGVFFLSSSFAGTALALVLGVLLNLAMIEKRS